MALAWGCLWRVVFQNLSQGYLLFQNREFLALHALAMLLTVLAMLPIFKWPAANVLHRDVSFVQDSDLFQDIRFLHMRSSLS